MKCRVGAIREAGARFRFEAGETRIDDDGAR
jgi:hypothetical protein